MSDFDLDAHLKKINSYSSGTEDAAKKAIRAEFARLQLLQPTVETYKQIANDQAREIVQLSVALEAANKPVTPVDLSWNSLDIIEQAAYAAIARFHDDQADAKEASDADIQ